MDVFAVCKLAMLESVYTYALLVIPVVVFPPLSCGNTIL